MENQVKEWSECYGKTDKEIRLWEIRNNSLCIEGATEGHIEIRPCRFVSDEGDYENEEFLFVGMTGKGVDNSATLLLQNREDIIKLRNYLTRFLEKQKSWVDEKKVHYIFGI